MLKVHMVRQAFTIVEILITITIMGILLTLAVVNVNSSQMNARDSERKADIEAIASSFETYYNTVNTNPSDGSDFWMSGSSYPDLYFLTNDTELKRATPDIDLKVVRAPGVDKTQPMSLIPATNATQTTAGVAPQPTFTTYVYQPLSSTNALCADSFTAGGCRKFNIFYRLESDGQVYQVTSTHQ